MPIVARLHEHQPCACRAHAFWRDGASTSTTPWAAVRQLPARREQARTRPEYRVGGSVTVTQSDTEEVRRTLRPGLEAGLVRDEGDLEPGVEPGAILARPRLSRDGRPRHGGLRAHPGLRLRENAGEIGTGYGIGAGTPLVAVFMIDW